MYLRRVERRVFAARSRRAVARAAIRLLPGLATAIVLFVVGVGLLYAYRAQTPAVPTVSLAQVLTEIQDGRVRAVTIERNQATLVLTDGRTERTTIPEPDTILAQAVTTRNQADPPHVIELRVT